LKTPEMRPRTARALSRVSRSKCDWDLIVVRLVTPSRFALNGALTLLLLTPLCGAQSMQREIAATFSAPPGCGDRTVLQERFEKRVPERRMRFESNAPVQFTIEETPTAVRSRLLILLEEGGELSRTIETESCEAAVEAIAFVAAVALDPGADDPLQLRREERLIPETATT